MGTEVTDRVRQFNEEYARAFDALDPNQITAFYDEPATIVDINSTVVFPTRREARANMARLANSYRSLGYESAEPQAIHVDQVSLDLYQADVTWTLHTTSTPIVFSTRYWIVGRGTGLRIAAVLAFNERQQTAHRRPDPSPRR